MKKFSFVSALALSFFFLVLPHLALAQGTGFVALAPIPGLTQGVTANSTALASFFNNLYKYLIGLAAILAVIQIIRGGLEIATQDNISKHADGRKHIERALMGLVLVLSPALIFSIINPSILNLSLSLPPLTLNTSPGTVAPASSVSPPGTTDNGTTQVTNGVTVGNYKTVVCANNNCTSAYSQQTSYGCPVSEITLYCLPSAVVAAQGASASVLSANQVVSGAGPSINQANPGCPSGQSPVLACVEVDAY